LEGREKQKRQPAEQRYENDAPMHLRHGIVGQMGSTQKLEERPAEHDREIRLVPVQTFR
jgi:hypothetical protein